MRLLCLILALVGTSTASFAQDGQTAARVESASGVLPSGLVPFLGLGAGYTGYHRDADVEGMPSSLKLLGSYYLPSQVLVFDLGAGLSGQRFSQSAAPERSVSGASIEAAARYQWANRWQAGLNAMNLLDQGSAFGANQADAHFAGVQALKEFSLGERWLARAGARLMADLNVNDRTVVMAMLDVHFGWNPKATSASVSSARETAATDLNPGLGSPTVATFAVDSDQLSPADRKALEALAKKIKALPKGELTAIEVIGHADPTGTDARNLKLSEARALTVKEVMTQAGVSVPVRVIGKGSREAVGSAHEEQRRVDLRLDGTKSEGALKEKLGL